MKRFVTMLLCASLAVTVPTGVFAQEESSAEFTDVTRQASEAYEAGDYDRAIRLFERAYELRPVSNILYNIGRIHEDAGNIDEAIEYYDQFVIAPNIEQTSRRDALDRLKTLREVKAMRDGGGETSTEVVETSPPASAPPAASGSNTMRTVGWVFVGVGGASLITGGVFALLAQSEFDDFDSATSLADRRAAASAGRTNAVVADSLLIFGGVSAIVGGVFLIASSGGSDTASSAARVSPVVGNAWGVSLDFNF